MTKWICVTKCYWGPAPHLCQTWRVGEIVKQATRPNKYFEPVNKVQKGPKGVPPEYMEKDKSEWTPDDMELATKKQLNEKFNLNLKDVKIIPKKTVIAQARRVA